MALGAFGLPIAVDQGLKLMTAFLADVLKDGHESTPSLTKQQAQKHRLYLKSDCGQHAIGLRAHTFQATSLSARRPSADFGRLFPSAEDSRSCAGGAPD